MGGVGEVSGSVRVVGCMVVWCLMGWGWGFWGGSKGKTRGDVVAVLFAEFDGCGGC